MNKNSTFVKIKGFIDNNILGHRSDKLIVTMVVVLLFLTVLGEISGRFLPNNMNNKSTENVQKITTNSGEFMSGTKEQTQSGILEESPVCSVDTTTCNTGSVVETTSDSGKILSKKLEEMRKDFDSVDLIFYDGRSTKNHASEVRKFVKDRYGIILPGVDTVAVYDTTFLSSRGSTKGAKIAKKWLPGIYEQGIPMPYGVVAIVVGDNWEEVLPKLFNEVLNSNN